MEDSGWDVLVNQVLCSPHEDGGCDAGCDAGWDSLTAELVMEASKHEEDVQVADIFHSDSETENQSQNADTSVGTEAEAEAPEPMPIPARAPVTLPVPVPSPVRGLAFSSSGPRSPPATANMRTSSWWAQLLKRHVKDMGCPDPYDSRDGVPPKTLLSVCTGIFCEAEVLRVPKTVNWIFSFFVSSFQQSICHMPYIKNPRP